MPGSKSAKTGKSEMPQPPPRKPGRKAFVRANVPLGERIAASFLVALMGAIGAGILIKGQHFDPHLYSVRSEALNSSRTEVEGKQGTLKEGEAREGALKEEAAPALPSPVAADSKAATPSLASPAGEEGHESQPAAVAANPATPAGVPAGNEPLEIPLPGIKPMGATEFYSPANLFEKIDGRAPAYLAFNCNQLRTRSFAFEGGGSSYVDVYEFRSDTPINAFGAFAMERDPNGGRLEFAKDGYAGALGYYFRQGNVYVQVIASDQEPKTLQSAKLIAEQRAKALPVDDAGLEGRRKLPAAGLIAESVSFIQDNAQGQEFLKNVFQASYQFESQKLTFFLMVTTPDQAAKNWQDFLAFSGKYGGKATSLPEVNGARVFKAENFGVWKVIYQREGEIGGVVDASKPEAAEQFITRYLKGEIQ